MAVIGLSGGEGLRRKLEEIRKNLSGGEELRLGFLEGSTYPDGTPTALVAAVDEFGNPANNQPPRPYFRSMIASKSPRWGEAMQKNLKATDYDANATLARMGEGIKGQLQQSIRDFDGVPLAPSTIAAKGSNKQLVDTAHMLNSVDYEVTGE